MSAQTPTPSARSRFANEGTYTPQSAGDTCFICECICDSAANGPCRCGCSECGCDDLHVMYPEEGLMTTTPARCERCDHPCGTCHHTAPPIAVGDVISEATMNTGRGVRISELRSNSRISDPDGDEWVKTRRRDGAWECLRTGDIAHLHQIAWPLIILHVAGRRK